MKQQSNITSKYHKLCNQASAQLSDIHGFMKAIRKSISDGERPLNRVTLDNIMSSLIDLVDECGENLVNIRQMGEEMQIALQMPEKNHPEWNRRLVGDITDAQEEIRSRVSMLRAICCTDRPSEQIWQQQRDTIAILTTETSNKALEIARQVDS